MVAVASYGPRAQPAGRWFDIQRGSSGSIDVGGTRVALSFVWLGNFLVGMRRLAATLETIPTSLQVGNVAQATLTPLKDQTGHRTRVEGAAAQAAFHLASMDLASSKGSRWSDLKLREWQGDSGTLDQFNWSA